MRIFDRMSSKIILCATYSSFSIRFVKLQYVAEKPAEGPVGVGAEASVDKLQLGSVEIETDNDLHVQAEDDLVPALPEGKEGVE